MENDIDDPEQLICNNTKGNCRIRKCRHSKLHNNIKPTKFNSGCKINICNYYDIDVKCVTKE